MLSLSYITTEGADPLEQAEAAIAAGFDAVGLRALAPTGRSAPPTLLNSDSGIERVRQTLNEQGLAILDLEVLTLGGRVEGDIVDRLLDGAARLGVHYVQVVCEDPDLDRAADQLAQIAADAAERDVGIALEFMAFRTADRLATALQMVERGKARILIDALHLIRSGGTAADIGMIAADRIAFLQLCDAPLHLPQPPGMTPQAALIDEARFNRLYPGEGALPLYDICKAIPAGTPISVEVPHRTMIGQPAAAQAATAFDWTRRFLDTLVT